METNYLQHNNVIVCAMIRVVNVGDRMWQFGVGLFLIDLAPESLQLTAIYGFASGGAVLLFGALIGDWVDNTARLTEMSQKINQSVLNGNSHGEIVRHCTK
ncbi:hypothetical protein KUTeg_008655 [Tegillarca granosa]|uniref:Solute carrier family 40 member n=1 Tax=Tegillarca granosa TaxID=220873 RepID=A0ABQ9F9P9_TEGGR|nr:hypothetical protein KUTeg_008655 [Tegillarca granosa]